MKLTLDPVPEVRDAAFSALGAIMKATDQLTNLLGDLVQDNLKMAKVRFQKLSVLLLFT